MLDKTHSEFYSGADLEIDALAKKIPTQSIENIRGLRQELQARVKYSDIVDSTEVDNPKLPLSANQGRVLAESIDKVSERVSDLRQDLTTYDDRIQYLTKELQSKANVQDIVTPNYLKIYCSDFATLTTLKDYCTRDELSIAVNPKLDKTEFEEFASRDFTTQGNEFNGPGQLVRLDPEGALPKLDGSQLYNLTVEIPDQSGFEYYGDVDPDQHINPQKLGAAYLNRTSGEIFVCVDNTPEKNRWVGQLGTKTRVFPSDDKLERLRYLKSQKVINGYKRALQYLSEELYFPVSDTFVNELKTVYEYAEMESPLLSLSTIKYPVLSITGDVVELTKKQLKKLIEDITKAKARYITTKWKYLSLIENAKDEFDLEFEVRYD